jgi:hypothetical protein
MLGDKAMPLSTFSYQASFDLFLKDLEEILEFVEPVDANKDTFSHRIYENLGTPYQLFQKPVWCPRIFPDFFEAEL